MTTNELSFLAGGVHRHVYRARVEGDPHVSVPVAVLISDTLSPTAKAVYAWLLAWHCGHATGRAPFPDDTFEAAVNELLSGGYIAFPPSGNSDSYGMVLRSYGKM